MVDKHSPDLSRRAFMKTSAAVGITSVGVLAGCTQKEESGPGQEAPKSLEENACTPPVSTQDKVYIVDTFKPKPGDGKSFLDDYIKTYGPLAKEGGLTLESSSIAPPIWLDDDSNIIQVIWSMPDIVRAAWTMSSITRYNPAYVEWWTDVRKRVVSRDRSYFASEKYLEVLNNV